MVREVTHFQNCYKTNSIITCHQITLHCSTAVQRLDLFLLVLLLLFSNAIDSPTRRAFFSLVRPSVCREIPKYSTGTPKVTGSKISDIYQSQEETYRRRNVGALAEIYQFPF